MNPEKVLLKAKNVGFDKLVPQSSIQTEADVEKYRTQGYAFVITDGEFKQHFPGIDSSNIYYTSSLSVDSIYFNRRTLAACSFNIPFLMLDVHAGKNRIPTLLKAIKECETDVAHWKFSSSLSALTDTMRMEYFELLFERYPDISEKVPDLFRLFFSYYFISDYGFNKLSSTTMEKILAAKRPEDQAEIDKQLENLPETLTVYRGGSNDVSTSPSEAYSWTIDAKTASFFACRLGNDGAYIAKTAVLKKDIINCCLDGREKEVIVVPHNVKIEEIIQLKGQKDCSDIIPAVQKIYLEHLNLLDELKFKMKSDIHGGAHEARVMLLTLSIAYYLKLPKSDQRVLAMAAIYHDTMRDNDGEDAQHGYYAADYYKSNEERIDPLVAFIIEYHCRPDEDGYARIQSDRALSKNRTRSKLLFDVFKDADALDRIRFGFHDLDFTRLRLPVSKTLLNISKVYLEQVRYEH